MGVSASAEQRYHGQPAVDLGVEPPIETVGKRHLSQDRRHISFRWLSAIVLTGLAGSSLIGITIYAALDGRSTLAQAPEFAVKPRRDAASTASPTRGDRLVKTADIVAEKQSFRAPTAVKIGDRQVVRMRGFTHVSTTLALAAIGTADDIPPFNPLKLLAADANLTEAQTDPGPALDDADVTFTTHDLAPVDPARFVGGLSADEIQAQVADYARTMTIAGRVPLPPQMLLMRTSRAGFLPANGLGFADPWIKSVPFSSIEVRMVPENVTVAARSDPSRDTKDSEERLVVFRHGDQLEDILRGNGASRDQIKSIVNAFNAKRGDAPVADGRRMKFLLARLEEGRPLQIARISVYADENLETTIALADDGTYVQVAKPDAVAKVARTPGNGAADEDTGGPRLYDSLYETALKQDIPRPIIDNLVRIFANDVDFQRSVTGGDSFDAFYADGDEGDEHGELLYASITVHNEPYRYYRFQTPDDNTVDYYDENGRSVRKFLMRNPVPSGIFTSAFGLRFHPILGYSRPHTGVDWAAPMGTPILAAGNGTVLRAHPESGYGNHIEIQHANGYITTYSHMSGFARGITDGVKVRQGQVIGYLGQTGLATGPHLHYEVIVNGHFVDPMRVKLARTREMDGKLLADFKRERDRIDGLMASAPNAVTPGTDKRASN